MRVSFFWVLMLLLASCYDTAFDSNDIVSNSEITYLDATYPKSSIPSDPYKIIAVTPILDTHWRIITEFGGGCDDHYFYTWWDGKFSSRMKVFLFHDGQGDECEAIVRDTLYLDLTHAFQGQFSDQIIEVRNETNGQSISVDPIISELIQKADCDLEVLVKESSCDLGYWGNRWFQLWDSTSANSNTGDSIWFQPVADLSETTTPDLGKYKVGLTLLLGYEYGNLNITCGTTNAYPVLVECIEGG